MLIPDHGETKSRQAAKKQITGASTILLYQDSKAAVLPGARSRGLRPSVGRPPIDC